MVASTCDGCVETVRLLIAKSADVNAKDGRGETPLHAAVEANDNEVIKLLLDKGANAAAPDGAGFTPLMASAYNCNDIAYPRAARERRGRQRRQHVRGRS